jgi:hypothetical protein
MRFGQRNGARDFAYDALSTCKVGWRVAAARTSVTERYRSGYDWPNANRQHERGPARETTMQIRHAAAPYGLPVVLNASPQ